MIKKHKKSLVFLGLFIICLIAGFWFFSRGENRLSGVEREWITNNQNHVQNVQVVNDVNIFGKNGKGLFYSFLSDFQDEYLVKLNYITLGKKDATTSLALHVGNSLPEHAFSFSEDHYVLVGKGDSLFYSKQDLIGLKIGVSIENLEIVKDYLGDVPNIDIISFESETELFASLDSNQISYIVLPRQEYMDVILNKYGISYHFHDLKRYFYIVDPTEGTLYHILEKYYRQWKLTHFEDDLNTEERTIFTSSLNISKTDLDVLQKSPVSYALKPYAPYEVYGDSKNVGILGEYLDAFSKFSNIDFKYHVYHNDRNLERDFQNQSITLISNVYSNLQGGTLIPTMIPMNASILAHDSNPVFFDGVSSLKNYTVYVEENTTLSSLVQKYFKEVKTYKNKDFHSIMEKKNNLVLVDSEVANYLLKHSYDNHRVVYQFSLKTPYAIRSYANDVFNKMMQKYFNYFDVKEAILFGQIHAREMEVKNSFFGSLARYMLYALVITIVILVLIFRSNKKVRIQKKVKKEDKLKYVDHLTSLKNRNYLNENLETWNKNTIYPQAVIVVDLNRVQEINDTFGYEEGDKQIIAAASILIKTQLDNTDIIRTDGNEFMVYLVGYSTKQVTSYLHKLTKEFKSLPHENGVCLSYSMIEADTKSIEDALNECVEDIKSQKDKLVKEDEK